ncbi:MULTISPECIES: N-acetylglucosaminidase [Paraliobacillus]|uniref:N-acetylglucosaminidase n=1 Tax=Paraliobacillus TaxID=200903 RepID=UPI000DD408CD|nr:MULTISPECIES: glucosaminidase domain-containing protein [Paraliobacillus]
MQFKKKKIVVVIILLLLSSLFIPVGFAESTGEDADSLYKQAQEQTSSSAQLSSYINGYELYPNDPRFEEGINSSAIDLINYTDTRHLAGDYGAAIVRYNAILAAPVLNEAVKASVEARKVLAQQSKTFETANKKLTNAKNQTNSSPQLASYIEGYALYPWDSRFTTGINESAVSLLDYAMEQHLKGNYGSAILRYNRILEAPALNSNTKTETEYNLEYAIAEKRTADMLYSNALKQPNSTSQLTSYIEGYNVYPSDARFAQGINSSALDLMNYAEKRHMAGDYGAAIVRYDTILAAPALDAVIKSSVESRKDLAEQEMTFVTADEQYNSARNKPNSTSQLAAFIDGYELYPNDNRFTTGINESALSLLNYAIKQHEKGEYGSAILRYESILSAPMLKDSTKKAAQTNLEYAVAKQRTPDMLYNNAVNQTTSSAKLTAYVEAYNLYPNDTRFENGINESARELLDYTTKRHEAGDYGAAIVRYDHILSVPVLNAGIKQEATIKREAATEGKIYRIADAQYNFAKQEANSSARLTAYIDGYNWYPNDQRFKEGINSSAQDLLNYASTQHEQGNYGSALLRYQLILSAPVLDDSIEEETKIKSEYAVAKTTYPTANQQLSIAADETNSSAKLQAYIDGYILYKGDTRFEQGINDSALALLDYASRQHEDGKFGSAILRYDLILSAPVLADTIHESTTLKRSYAAKDQLYRTADEQIVYAESQTSSTPQLNAYIEGYYLYLSDTRFVDGMNEKALSLLDYGTRIHQEKNYSGAITRYDLILSVPELDELTVLETEAKRAYAVKNTTIPTADQLASIAESETSSSAQLSAYQEAYLLYPEDGRFLDGLNQSAQSLLNWASEKHRNSDFSTAIHRYNVIISTIGVNDTIKDTARERLALAVEGIKLQKETIEYSNYSYSLTQALAAQMLVNPQTDKYSSQPGYVHSSWVNKGTINKNVNIRTAATLSSSSIYKATTEKTTVSIISTVTGAAYQGSTTWYKISYDGKTLYVHVSLVDTDIDVHSDAKSSSHVYGDTSSVSLNITGEKKGATINNSNVWYEINYTTWRSATESDVLAYLNPNQNNIFQHLVLSSSVGVSYTELNKLLVGKGVLSGQGKAFIEATKEHLVNEIYLISHALLETGNGGSELATGIQVGIDSGGNYILATDDNKSKLSSIKTVYNMYGIGANDGDAKRLGAIYAYKNGWTSVEKAIIGGAEFIGEKYIHANPVQNTLYKMRWNPTSPASHQYATDIGWAVKQISRIESYYEQLNNPLLHFDIPVYK